MKNVIGIVLLVLLCVGLGVALIVRHNKAEEQRKKDESTIVDYSNKLSTVNLKLDDETGLNTALQKDIEKFKGQMVQLTNVITETQGVVEKTQAELEAQKKATDEAKAEITKLKTNISELETQNASLDRNASELTNAIARLNFQIAETEQKLRTSEGDKIFLQSELKRLLQDKADMERKFNDYEVLRAQLKKLKEEITIARRIDWIRRGVFGEQKGAQRLMQGANAPAPARTVDSGKYDLNVEVGSDGSLRVIPPLGATNAPASSR
jgi:chromosome segregation ATPase